MLGRKKIKVKYHPSNPRRIYLLNESSGNYETFEDIAPWELPEHARLEEIFDCKKYRKFVREGDEDIRVLDRVAHNRLRDEEIKLAAESRAQAIAPASKAEHLSDIQAKRAFEAQVQRTMEAYQRSSKDGDIADVKAVSDEYEAPTSLLSKLLAEAEEEIGNE